MRKIDLTVGCVLGILAVSVVSAIVGCAARIDDANLTGITVEYPLTNTVFPPEIVAPTFRWADAKTSDAWRITVELPSKKLEFLTRKKFWGPDATDWEEIKNGSMERDANVVIRGFRMESPKVTRSRGSVAIRTSRDSVGAPIFYREVILPFEEAVKDPSRIRWRFGLVSSARQPPIVLEKLPVCGNCHSFSKNGKTLALEVDSGNDKGAYAVTPVMPDIILDRTKIISWADFRREDKDPTFGLLCQVSPDGRFIAGTVKDQALAVYRPNLMFSQLFFLIKGIVAIYDRTTRRFSTLPGASDRNFCQTNATWSPDGSTLVFARAKGYNLDAFQRQRRALVGGREAEDFLNEQGKTYQYDLCRIPFNAGKGGAAEPLAGASANGMSNYFAKHSPDGKWIVFCQARNYMLLQPDSKLYIMPSRGGEARPLECNTPMMNSWHSWSPNSRWLVFSSKWNGPYTKLMLTHIDEQGHAAPPVVLERFSSVDRAANIPEFVNNAPDSLVRIHEDYLDSTSYYRIANEFHKSGLIDRAIPAYREAIKWNPKNYHAHNNLGALLFQQGRIPEAKQEFIAANNLHIDDIDRYEAHTNLAVCLIKEKRYDEALQELETAYRLCPNDTTKANLAQAREDIQSENIQESIKRE
jgi:tetratricopeptide (TPR) repeat protein